jgi:hypothetical protein
VRLGLIAILAHQLVGRGPGLDETLFEEKVSENPTKDRQARGDAAGQEVRVLGEKPRPAEPRRVGLDRM